MNVIKTNNLTKFYGKYKGIENINLEINKGEIFGFIGPNGAGKSTTIRLLLSLIYPTSGTAFINGMDCVKESQSIKEVIGYTPSEVNYYDDMTVKELFEYSAKFYKKDCSKRVKKLSEYLELDISKKIKNLSFGNKKKVAIIQALQHEPELLIFDEPTGGLDPLIQNKFFEILQEEKSKGNTILFSSHILSEVQRVCDRVAIIKNGNILKVENVETLRNNNFKKVQVKYNGELPNLIIEGISDYKKQNSKIEFLYKGNINNLLTALASHKVENASITEPPLEDIFLHYYESEE